MSTIARDPRGFFGNPRLSRSGGENAGKWHWPDPELVAPPEVAPRRGEDTRSWQGSADTLDALWPTEPPVESWPSFLGAPVASDELIEPSAERQQEMARSREAGASFARDLAEAYPIPQAYPSAHAERGREFSTLEPYASNPQPAEQGGQYVDEALPPPAQPGLAPFAGALQTGWVDLSAIPDEPAPRIDPSPSRLAYRLNRLWLTPFFRQFVRFGLPVLLTVGCLGLWLSDAGRRADLWASVESLRVSVENQPVFLVTGLEVQSRSPEVAQGVAQLLPIEFPLSSFRLDYDALRTQVEALDVVERASVGVHNGVLRVRITERLPAMIWRGASGLDLIDATGHRVARLARRDARADLPLIAGRGAPEAIAEAQALLTIARPLQERLRGLVRVGERRWDIVLDRDQRIMLPETGALAALERVLALDAAQDLLSRDVQVVDMRNPSRPVLRLPQGTIAALSPHNRP